MEEIKKITNLRDVLENPLSYITSKDREDTIRLIPELFMGIAKVLFENYDIHICDSQGNDRFYSFAEIEFYYHKKGILDREVDNCVYPRTCEAGKFLWHDTGVDICFESKADIDDYYFGGILIRSLIDKVDKQTIGGPGRCANELAFLCKAGETPELCLKKERENVKLGKTIRQGIDCDVDKDGNAIVKYCYFIVDPKITWKRTKQVLKMKSDFKGYIRDNVTYNYPDNPESDRIDKLMKKRMEKEKKKE